MPTQQLVYEGTDLQALIQRVVDEHGPARIRPPERRRKGGVLGFFAKEVYVISVDREATERAGQAHDGDGRTPVTAAPAAGGGRHWGRAAHAPSPALAASLADLIDATEDDLHLATSGRGHGPSVARAGSGDGAVSGAGGTPGSGARTGGTIARPRAVKPFSQVLSEVASSLGEEPGTYRVDPDRFRRITPLVPPPATTVGPGQALAAMIDHPAGTATTSPAVEVGPVAAVPAPAPVAPAQPEPGAAPAGPEAATAPVEVVPAPTTAPAAETIEVTAPAAEPGPAAPAADVGAPPSEAAVPPAAGAPALPPAPVEPTDEAPVATVQPAPSPAPTARRSRRPRPALGTALVDLLLAAGFPEALLPGDGAALSGLEEAFTCLPEAPPLPDEAGGLVAVVGDAQLVRPLARSVASRVGCPEDEVAVVAPSAWNATPAYRARTPQQAASLAGGWRRDRVGVVAVYAPTLGADQQWTRDVLHAVRPSCVWATAMATTKPEDVRRWVDAIGGADALAMTGVAATATPAAILSVGLPVVRLDDERATAHRWAAVVADLATGS